MDGAVVGTWALVGGLVLYLGLDGGGYDIVTHSQVAEVVWWLVLVGAAWGLLPATRPTGLAWGALGLFGAFVAWTAVATTWSLSAERSLADLSLVIGYLGVLAVGVLGHRDRDQALRHTIGALATAIVIIAVLALASRLDPGLISAAGQTHAFLQGSEARLSWPLNYWNALAAFLAFGLPLLLALASTARTLRVQALAAAALPLLVLCGYLTFSRGGLIAAALAVLAFLALAPERFPKVATFLTAAGGSAILIAAAIHRHALEQGLSGAVARHQGATMVLPIILVCGGVGLTQVAIALAHRHGTPPRLLDVSPRRARWLLAGGVVAVVVAALAAGVPARLSHAWNDFKHSTGATSGYSLARFGSTSGNGRYDYWRVVVHSLHGHAAAGWGPGTFQLVWLPHATASGYVQNAHSLYFETLSDLGVVGLVLLVAFLVVFLGAAMRLVVRSSYERRTRAAAATAALLAFMVSAAFEWIWQVPVLPVALLLLGAAVLAPQSRPSEPLRPRGRGLLRATMALLSVACLVAVAVPLATADAVGASQRAVATGDITAALRDAQQAARVEPKAASAQIQLALVEELRGDLVAAIAAARHATADEAQGWTGWLILSRLEAEAGKRRASLAAFARARSLNPYSPVFAHA